MYNPISLELINFGSHENTVYKFPKNQTTLVQGINETNRGQKSNGSGKSFISEGLAYASSGSSLRKIKDKELVMDGKKEAIIRFIAHNPINDHTLDITRKIYSNTKSGELTVEGENNITSVNEGNSLILTKLGISRDELLNYFLLSKEKYTSFFIASDTAKKDLINRFSKADQINPAVESCEYDVKDFTGQITALENKLNSKKDVLSSLQAITGVNNDVEIQTIKNENKSLREAINSLNENIKELEYKLEPLKIEVHNAQSIKDKFEPSIKAIDDNIREYQDLMDEIDRHFKNEVECPECHHTFSLKDDTFSLSEAKEIYPTIKDSIADLRAEKDLKNDDLKKSESSLKYAKSELQEVEFNIKTLVRDIGYNERTILSNNKRIEELSKVVDNGSEVSSIKDQINELEPKLSDLKSKLKEATEWHLRLKRFKGWIANKSLKNIESHANFYLDKLDSDLQIEISGFTLVNNGKELREKIDVKVFRNGSEASFNRFSGGEKARIEVAIILSMQRIINQSTDGLGLNLLFIDEILDSIDSTGLESLLKSLNKLNLNVMIITHATIETNYENILTIKKVDGISEILD
jgi:DNA repair protein SbcC/Rad50